MEITEVTPPRAALRNSEGEATLPLPDVGVRATVQVLYDARPRQQEAIHHAGRFAEGLPRGEEKTKKFPGLFLRRLFRELQILLAYKDITDLKLLAARA